MGAGTMILTIMIMLYVSSSLHMQFLSHAQTVTKEVHRMNTWHMTLPPYMDTTGSNSQQEGQAYWKSFKYMIDIKINSSREIINDRLMRLLQGHTFPYSVNQNIKIANIHLNTSQPVKLLKYAINIKINASSKAVIGRLRGLLHNQQFPVCIKKGIKISSANLTTVCLSNTNRTECRCENQYFWSTEQCAKHGVCDGFQNDTCGCIASPPTDGKSCQRHPAPPPKSFKYILALKINASSKAVVGRLRGLLHGQQFPVCIKKSMEISSANLTTERNADVKIDIFGPLNNAQNMVFVMASKMIPVDASLLLQPMGNPASGTLIEISYKNVFGMDFPVSVTVTGFRPGSVIVDFFITSFAEIQSYVKINQELITNLNEFKFNVDPNSIAETEQIEMHPKTAVFPEENMQLNCLAKNNLGRPEWRFKGNIIQQSTDTSANHYEFSADGLVLTVKNVGINNNGRYECLFNTSKGLHILWDKIEAIKPYPGMQVPSNKTYRCENKVVELSCCVHLYYSIEWKTENKMLSNKEDLKCISYNYIITTDLCGSTNTFICKLTNKNFDGFSYGSKAVQLKISSSVQQQPNSPVTCFNDVYGFGNVNQIASGDCDKDQIGRREGVCLSNGTWLTVKSDCVLRVIDDLKQQSQGLDAETLKDFVITLDNVTSANKDAIVQSPATVSTLVGILDTIAEVSTNVKLDENMLTGILQIVDVLSSDAAKPIWQGLNTEDTSQGSSSKLLNAIEHIIKAVSDQPISLTSPTKSFIFKKITTSEKNFKDVLDLNSTAEILIPNITSTQANVSVTTVAFSSLRNVMPARDQNDNLNVTDNVINGLMVIVNTSRTINNIQLRFQKVNDSEKLANTQCVFWEFSLFNGTGGWDSTGCELIDDENDNVTCRCNHTTSFSILMSPAAPNDLALSVITYIGVSVSIASLVVCLIIEALIWKAITRNETSHMRHVSMVNVALSLLIADICFIIGAAVVKPGEDFTNPCSTVVFFTHFFYLALFFWMLMSALLLLYRTMMVFSNMSKTKMMVIAFFVGYGGPLLISVITVAATAESKTYITSNGACWLNWDQSKALLAFVVPALVIVAVNIVVVIVVVSKMLRRGIGERTTDERNVLKVIIRCVAILTPLFGITWGLGLGIMIEPKALAVHYLFAIFNSFQGLFVLVLGTLMEKKVRETLKARIRHIGSITQSSSAGSHSYNRNNSSGRTTLTDVISTLLRRGRNVGSHGQHSSSASESFLNS